MQMSWRPSIGALIAMIVVSPIAAVALILVSLSWASTARISSKLADEVMTAAAATVASEVRDYLGDAVRVSDRYVRRIESGVLPDPPATTWEREMTDDLETTPSVASICYGNIAGDATWLLRAHGRLEVGRVNGAKPDEAVEYQLDPPTGRTATNPIRVYSYDPRKRPWWAIAATSNSPRWTPIYTWFAGDAEESTIGTGYTRQIHRRDGALAGVLVVDVTLGALSDFLRRSEIAQRGQVFVVDDGDRLIASSIGRVTDESGSAITRAVPESEANIDGAPARAHVSSLSPYPGIDWRVVTVLPESAFMADAKAVRRRAIGASIAAAFASLVFGLALSRFLSRPILRINTHVQRVGRGDFDSRLQLRGAKELTALSDEINRMTGGLRERMALEQSLAVATEVQQSLLPLGTPKCRGLDVAGCSQYCDSTGGDYYDFIDLARSADSSLIIAMGDVTGHGIGAALLMAVARGALRCGALQQTGLSALLTRANDVLATDNRHNRFMTLALLEIDGDARKVKWASAGHDPAIIYRPRDQSFQELEGGEFPLGVVQDVTYSEYESDSIAPNSVMVIGTDGVWEMFNERDELYGKQRLRDVVRAHHESSASEIVAALEADLAAFRGMRKAADDVTFVVVKFIEPNLVADGGGQ